MRQLHHLLLPLPQPSPSESSLASGLQISEGTDPWSPSATLGFPVPAEQEGRRDGEEEERGGGPETWRKGRHRLDRPPGGPSSCLEERSPQCWVPTHALSAGGLFYQTWGPRTRAGANSPGAVLKCPTLPTFLSSGWSRSDCGALKAGMAPHCLLSSVASTCQAWSSHAESACPRWNMWTTETRHASLRVLNTEREPRCLGPARLQDPRARHQEAAGSVG